MLVPRSCLGNEAVHDFLVAGLVEFDRQLVLFDGAHGAVAKFLVEDAVAGGEAADMRHFRAAHGDAAPLNERRPAVPALAQAEFAPGEIGPGKLGELRAAAPGGAHMRREAGLSEDLDMVRRQLADEARRGGALPGAVDAAVGGEGDGGAMAGAGDADIGEAALLLEPGEAVLVHRTLARKQPLLPARQE